MSTVFERIPQTVLAVQYTGANISEIRAFVAPFALVIPTNLPGPGRAITPGLNIQFITRTLGLRHGHWLLSDDPTCGLTPLDPAEIADHFRTCSPVELEADYRPRENRP